MPIAPIIQEGATSDPRLHFGVGPFWFQTAEGLQGGARAEPLPGLASVHVGAGLDWDFRPLLLGLDATAFLSQSVPRAVGVVVYYAYCPGLLKHDCYENAPGFGVRERDGGGLAVGPLAGLRLANDRVRVFGGGDLAYFSSGLPVCSGSRLTIFAKLGLSVAVSGDIAIELAARRSMGCLLPGDEGDPQVPSPTVWVYGASLVFSG